MLVSKKKYDFLLDRYEQSASRRSASGPDRAYSYNIQNFNQKNQS